MIQQHSKNKKILRIRILVNTSRRGPFQNLVASAHRATPNFFHCFKKMVALDKAKKQVGSCNKLRRLSLFLTELN